ncbi:DUF5694 domain-containing protein [Maricaulis parjimensis]|uniref:DUF5694 domain-containing protein n=1 Tax=Maricaulis parjimensis TaxID=144023 RepID=UPI0019399AED|nr:DUF5694 domain-containing protein [Maricaulis parjimensis]
MKTTLSLASLLAGSLSLASPAIAQAVNADTLPGSPVFDTENTRPAIDFAGVQRTLGGEPTQVLILGTKHLNNLPEAAFDPAHLSLLLDALEEFAPDVIALESIGGRTCYQMRGFAELHDGAADRYCTDPQPALNALGISQPEAALAVEMTLDTWPDAPSPAERRHLAALFYGAGEPWSAALQWAQLDEAEQIAADGVDDALLVRLERLQESRNENQLIGVELGQRLGLTELATMDDHTADYIYTRSPDTLGPAIQSVWSTEHPLEAEYAAMEPGFLGSPDAVLDGYRFLNSAAYQRFTIEKDFGAAAASGRDDAVTRQYLAWWQTRGLRMAANVVEAAGNQPGARVLVIVGSSHKAYFEAYLDQMHDFELVSLDSVLDD